MAKRRRWSTGKRLAYGFSEGASNFLDGLMRSRLADKQAERIAQRQEEADIRAASRQELASRRAEGVANRRLVIEQLPKISSGEMQPNALTAMMDAMGMGGMFPSEFDVDYQGTGEPQREAVVNAQATGQALEGLRPPMRRSLKPIGEQIDKATDPTQVPDIQSIVNQARAADDRASEGGIPTEALIDPTEPESMVASMAPDVRDYVNQAMGKSQMLRDKPGDALTIENPDGSKTTRTPTQAELIAGITTAPDAQAQGTQAGNKELATLDIVGDARVRQGAREAGAAGRARTQAEIDTKLANQKALIEFDVAKATAELGVIGAEVDARQYATQIADAREAASKAGPVITELQNTWLNAQPVLEQWSGVTGGAGLTGLESAPAWMKDQALVNYDKYVDAVRPLLARAFGQTGNPALMEQEWAKYTPSYMMALRPDDALRQLARLETLLLSQVQMAQLARQKGTALTGEDIDAIIAPRIESVFQQLKGQADEMRKGRVGGGAKPMTVPQAGANPGAANLANTRFTVTANGIQLSPKKE